MTTIQLAVIVLGFAAQMAGLAYIARILHLMRTSFTPGEAAIFHEQRKLAALYDEMARTLREATP